jgi:hypothetical protein
MPTKKPKTRKEILDVKDLYYLPPDPDANVLAYWRWHNRVVVWPCSPTTFQQFWERIDSYKSLRLWAEEPAAFPRPWVHALLSHLSNMWQECRGQLKPTPIRTGRRGRPKVEINIERDLSILDLIMLGLLEKNAGRIPRHWIESVKLLKHVFKDQFPETWNQQNLKPRVNAYLREHRAGGEVKKQFDAVVAGSLYLVSSRYRQDMQIHLSRDFADLPAPDTSASTGI